MSTEQSLEAQLLEVRETNRRLNRRCRKLEQRINRWESRQYTLARWRRWTAHWWREEKERADRLYIENKKLKSLSLINKLFQRIAR